jgi:hypothetical protein
MTIAKNMPTDDEINQNEETDMSLETTGAESDVQINIDDDHYVTLKDREKKKKAEDSADAKQADGRREKKVNKYTVHTPIPRLILDFCLALFAGGSQGMPRNLEFKPEDCITLNQTQERVLEAEIERHQQMNERRKEKEREKEARKEAMEERKEDAFRRTLAYEEALLKQEADESKIAQEIRDAENEGEEKGREMEVEKDEEKEGKGGKRNRKQARIDTTQSKLPKRLRKKVTFTDYVKTVGLDGTAAEDEEEIELDFRDPEWSDEGDD